MTNRENYNTEVQPNKAYFSDRLGLRFPHEPGLSQGQRPRADALPPDVLPDILLAARAVIDPDVRDGRISSLLLRQRGSALQAARSLSPDIAVAELALSAEHVDEKQHSLFDDVVIESEELP